ncbi:hypothetical protein L596_027719 [Steinernema carpocapsae]|uniref:ADP/ATP translocase n=1 Tax=Steinernema carpocapsae TaxID=34508 RepID=A0A4U5LWC4_STECR|nr:hypothetical protein L596_027719 [Steinernema carpocapsae]
MRAHSRACALRGACVFVCVWPHPHADEIRAAGRKERLLGIAVCVFVGPVFEGRETQRTMASLWCVLRIRLRFGRMRFPRQPHASFESDTCGKTAEDAGQIHPPPVRHRIRRRRIFCGFGPNHRSSDRPRVKLLLQNHAHITRSPWKASTRESSTASPAYLENKASSPSGVEMESTSCAFFHSRRLTSLSRTPTSPSSWVTSTRKRISGSSLRETSLPVASQVPRPSASSIHSTSDVRCSPWTAPEQAPSESTRASWTASRRSAVRTASSASTVASTRPSKESSYTAAPISASSTRRPRSLSTIARSSTSLSPGASARAIQKKYWTPLTGQTERSHFELLVAKNDRPVSLTDNVKPTGRLPRALPEWGCSVWPVTTVTSGLLCYPWDTVRRRMMMQSAREAGSKQYKNTMDCWKMILATEGPSGFYKGALGNVFRGMGSALVLAFYSEICKFID